MARGQKPKIVRCGNHWAVDFYSAIGEDFPVWWCFNTWSEALERALKVAAWHKDRLSRLLAPRAKRRRA
jgi:hypothetical protein